MRIFFCFFSVYPPLLPVFHPSTALFYGVFRQSLARIPATSVAFVTGAAVTHRHVASADCKRGSSIRVDVVAESRMYKRYGKACSARWVILYENSSRFSPNEISHRSPAANRPRPFLHDTIAIDPFVHSRRNTHIGATARAVLIAHFSRGGSLIAKSSLSKTSNRLDSSRGVLALKKKNKTLCIPPRYPVGVRGSFSKSFS